MMNSKAAAFHEKITISIAYKLSLRALKKKKVGCTELFWCRDHQICEMSKEVRFNSIDQIRTSEVKQEAQLGEMNKTQQGKGGNTIYNQPREILFMSFIS